MKSNYFSIQITHLLMLGVLFITIGCSNEEIIPLNDNLELKVKDGRLKFDNFEVIGNFMEFAKKTDPSEFETQIRNLENHDFHSLQPDYGYEDVELIERVQSRKLQERAKLMRIYPNARTLSDDEEIDEEDEIISDPYFASILNEEREIIVGSDVYKYTLDGVYFTDESNTDALYEYLENRESEENPNGRMTFFGQGQHEVARGVYLIVPEEMDDECGNMYRCGGGGSSGGGNTGGGSSGSGNVEPNIENFKLCDKLKKNLWTSVFGPKVECTDYHDKRRRIKTKVWNQNYFLYSSIGISVRAQKRRLRIWWANKVDELRLGFSHATFEFPKVKIQWPDNSINYYYTTPNGNHVDQYGRPANWKALHPSNAFDRFPINDKEKVFFTIYTDNDFVKKLIKECRDKDNSCNLFKLSGKDINKKVEDLAKSSVRSLWNWGEGKLEAKAPILAVEMNDCFGSSQSGCNEEELMFTYINWNKKVYNNNDIKFIFDWNTAEIGIKLNGKDNYSNPRVSIKNTAKSYKKLSLTGYGLGRRGSTWKGGRVKFDDE